MEFERVTKEHLLQYEKLLKQEVELKTGLPHLWGMPWYKWAREFFESTNRINFLTAGNQLSKSSTQIRKCIDWATNIKKWETLWRIPPIQFWYLYPTKDVATGEFEMKWVKEWLPRGKYKDHPQYGWVEQYKDREINSIRFHSGVTVFFKTYAQNVQHLQTATAHAIFCDEELPSDIFDELQFRLAATDGYFHMVFTATLGQEIWRRTIEERGTKEELFPQAAKWQVSAYDCMQYEDGSPSPWTKERIQRMINSCKNENEVMRRVWGRFVVDEGLKYPTFQREKNIRAKKDVAHFGEWEKFSGVDIGSGGSRGHPAAIAFVAVNASYTFGVAFRAWRGDGIDTTSSDILNKYIQLRGSMQMSAQYYDWQSKDFFNYAARVGESFTPAEKNQEFGEDVLNVLFKNEMLVILDDDPELDKLAIELSTVRKSTNKSKARDDLADALRFAVTKIPWDWSKISCQPLEEKREEKELTQEQRRRGMDVAEDEEQLRIEQEFSEWNALYEGN